MKLDDWQENFLKTAGDKVLCCGRQIGKSVICGIDAEEYSTKNSKKTILMMAPTERQAFALFEKTLSEIIFKNKKMLSKGKDKPTKHKITLTNKTRIFCLPVGLSGIGVRFLTVDRLYADEASRIPEEVWTAVTPMLLTTGGDSVYLSTAAGNKGYFADVVLNRDNAFKSFTRFQESSEDVINKRPICETWTELQKEKALEHLAREKARMTKLQYQQEYLGMIVEELRQFFPDALIKQCAVLKRRKSFYRMGDYYLGVDIARMGEDESTFEIVDKKNNNRFEQVENIVTKKTLTTDTLKRIFSLEDSYHFKQIFVDAYNVGVGVFDTLLDDERTRRKTIALDHWPRPLTRDEKKRTKTKKEDLFQNLKALMEQGKIKLLDDDDLIASLKSIQAEQEDNKLVLWGNSDHITDGLVRAAWCAKDKSLNIWIR